MFRLAANAIPSFRGNNPAAHAVSGVGEAEDQVPALTTASANPSPTPIQSIPPWVRELNNSRVTRHSRASSVVSTQTKFTTNTLHEDARSIDINVGGQYFRISRDGSRVTADAPPPYTGPGEVIRFRADRTRNNILRQGDADLHEESEIEGASEDGAITPRSTFATLSTEAGVRANILDPTEIEMPSPIGYDQLHHRASTATLVPEVTEPLSPPGRGSHVRRAASQDATSSVGESILPSPLRRTNGVRLPRLITSGDIPRASQRPQRFRQRSNPSPNHPLQVHSADAILGYVPQSREPRSPDYIGRDARGQFPFPIRPSTAQNATSTSRSLASEEEEDETQEENSLPPTMDDENDISLHYARLMRTLDAAHRKAIHFKDKQVSELREKLNEKDIVLRQQLRAKDFIIDDLKSRLNNLEENVEMMLEKARNSVEDLWESRWKDRDFHLRERMRRIEEDAQKTIETLRVCRTKSGEASNSPA